MCCYVIVMDCYGLLDWYGLLCVVIMDCYGLGIFLKILLGKMMVSIWGN